MIKKLNYPIDQTLCQEVLLTESPQGILFSLFKRFKERAAIVTSGQLSGMVLIHLAAENGLPFRVCTLDTLRLFPETYDFLNRVASRYGIEIEQLQPDPQEVQEMVAQHGEYLFFDSKAKQEYCCNIRKVRPMQRLLESLDVWITGLRRDQSESRKQLRKAEIISSATHPVLKVSPLLQWTADEVWEFVRENEIPVNPLLEADAQGHYYESIGCVICTTPIKPGELNRAGRWRWQNAPAASENADTEENAKECGLHYSI
ncbi:phosphoadenylyl-sulfate reductase [Candidatus Poribacteria bacterium]|nr:MAG: phosphoadenylyl-sulfate reductase [Candidatus Poribacteria bacterium]